MRATIKANEQYYLSLLFLEVNQWKQWRKCLPMLHLETRSSSSQLFRDAGVLLVAFHFFGTTDCMSHNKCILTSTLKLLPQNRPRYFQMAASPLSTTDFHTNFSKTPYWALSFGKHSMQTLVKSVFEPLALENTRVEPRCSEIFPPCSLFSGHLLTWPANAADLTQMKISETSDAELCFQTTKSVLGYSSRAKCWCDLDWNCGIKTVWNKGYGTEPFKVKILQNKSLCTIILRHSSWKSRNILKYYCTS